MSYCERSSEGTWCEVHRHYFPVPAMRCNGAIEDSSGPLFAMAAIVVVFGVLVLAYCVVSLVSRAC